MRPKATETNDASSLDAVGRLAGLMRQLQSVDSCRPPTPGFKCVQAPKSVPGKGDEKRAVVGIISERGRDQKEESSTKKGQMSL